MDATSTALLSNIDTNQTYIVCLLIILTGIGLLDLIRRLTSKIR